MAEAGLQVPDIPAPLSLPAQQQPTQQAQQIVHLNWSYLSQNFQEN